MRAGDRAGPFELLKRTSIDAWFQLFDAEDTTNGSRCVVQVLLPHIAGDAAVLAAYSAGLKRTQLLSHPNIQRFIAEGREGPFAYAAFASRNGESLRAAVEKAGPMDVDESV